MEFLHDAMPAEEFRAYCDQINKVRNVKEGSSDFVKPDDFVHQPQRNSVPAEPHKNMEEENAGPQVGRNSI